jgi:hypothetical protein
MTGFAAGSPDYFGLVDQVTSMVTAVVPPSKTVLVVSKGDENLLQLGSRTGWHFPRTDDGRYAGHYPADSDDAIRQLESLRERGAGYIVFPATSLWWLDHYPELGRHLDNSYTCLVRDDEACAIYDVTEVRASNGAEPVAQQVQRPSPETLNGPVSGEGLRTRGSAQLVAFLDNLLPEHAHVRVASSEGELRSVEADGVEFLVLPRESRVVQDSPELLDELERRYRCVARQRYLGTVYDLTRAQRNGREIAPTPQKTPWWRRLFRRG